MVRDNDLFVRYYTGYRVPLLSSDAHPFCVDQGHFGRTQYKCKIYVRLGHNEEDAFHLMCMYMYLHHVITFYSEYQTY